MKKKKKRIMIIAVLIAVIVIAAAAIIYFVKNRSGSVVDVYSMDLLNSSGWFENDSQLSGTITSDYVQEIYPNTNQKVEKVYVKQGDTVKEGDKLLKYNVEEQELDVQLQKLQIKAAKLEIQKMEDALAKLKGTKTVGAVDGTGSAQLSASLNLPLAENTVLASVADQTTSKETSKSAGVKEGDSVALENQVSKKEDHKSGDGKTEDTAYKYLVAKKDGNRATVKGSVVQSLLDENAYAVFKEYESSDDYNNNKDPLATFRITPEMADIGLDANKTYTLEALGGLVIKKQLKESISSVSDVSSGDGTEKSPYVFRLLVGGTVQGSVVQNLIENKKYAFFEEYASEKAYHDKEKAAETLTVVSNPEKPYVTDDIESGTAYKISEIKTKLNAKLRKKITGSDQYDSGDGTEGSHYIFLMADNGKVKGSVVLELIKNEEYAYFKEYKSEDAYSSDKKNPADQLEVRPEYLTNGILDEQEYTLDELKNLVKEPAKTNVLKSTISDKQKDAVSGDGTSSNPYVYLLIQNGVIRGSVVNDIMANQQYAVFYEYESEEIYKAGTDKNPVQVAIRPGMIFKESLSSFAGYTITDIIDLIVTADKIEITPAKKKVTTGKTYTFKTKLMGKNKEALTVTWELKRNKSKSTTLVNGVLTVGADESAKTLRIIARAGDKKAVLTLTVVKSSTGSSAGTSEGPSIGSDDGGNIGDGGDSYTAEELKDAISEKEDEIAEAKQDLNEAQINYKEAKKEVDAAMVKAKVSGKVTLAYTADAMPTDGSAAIIVRAEDGMYVKTSVSEMDLDTIQVGGTILCTSWETGEEYEAVVKEISDFPTSGSSSEGMSNPNSSYYPVVAYIEDADGLSTGESVSISYSSQSMGTVSEDTIYLQKAYIRTEGRQSYVYKEGKKGRLTKQYIKTGETIYGQYVEVLSGITMDDNLAFPYGKNVKEGAKVQLSENEDDIIY